MSDLAILFADVAGSTAIYQRHGDTAALQWIDECIAIMRHATEGNAGRVIKTIGDELMAVFRSADDAMRAACDIQWEAGDMRLLGQDRMSVRIGFHYGAALERDNDVFGDSVNVAARLVALAKGGQIITSGRTVEAMDRMLAQHTRKLDRLPLKGMINEETIYEALWEDGDGITTMLSDSLVPATPRALLRLRYEGVSMLVGPDRQRLSFGRDASNDVVIVSRRASRVHAIVEWRRDKYFLIDRSTNGTYVRINDGNDILLRLEEMTLHGKGAIGFGHPVGQAGETLLEFECDAEEAPAPVRAVCA